jgi:hypothetical protein
LDAESVGECSVTSYDRALNLRAKVVIAGEARMAPKTAVSRPTDTDTLPNLEPFGFFAKGNYSAHRLMPRNKGIDGYTPLVVEHREIGMTDPTVTHLDLDFLATDLAGIEVEWLQRAAGSVGSVSMECGHMREFWLLDSFWANANRPAIGTAVSLDNLMGSCLCKSPRALNQRGRTGNLEGSCASNPHRPFGHLLANILACMPVDSCQVGV